MTLKTYTIHLTVLISLLSMVFRITAAGDFLNSKFLKSLSLDICEYGAFLDVLGVFVRFFQPHVMLWINMTVLMSFTSKKYISCLSDVSLHEFIKRSGKGLRYLKLTEFKFCGKSSSQNKWFSSIYHLRKKGNTCGTNLNCTCLSNQQGITFLALKCSLLQKWI